MGIVGTFFRCWFGTLAGVIRLTPFVVEQMLTGRSLPLLAASNNELGSSLLKNSESIKETDFKDVYITNTKDGVRLHAVVDNGANRIKGKRPIVFVHGFPEMWISWIDQLEHFRKLGHPVLALDMRGYGLSDKPQGKGGLENYHLYDKLCEDLRTAVQYAKGMEGNDDVTPLLVAHDWGSSVAWAYVKQSQTIQNKEVAGYLSLSIPPPECFEANVRLQMLYDLLYMWFFNMPWLPEKTLLANSAWMLGKMMTATKQAILPTWMINAYRNNCLQQGAMTAQLNYYRMALQLQPKDAPEDALVDPKTKTLKKKLDLPIRLVTGKDDGAIGEFLFDGYDRFLANAKYRALDNCSHWMQADCPALVNEEIEKLVAEV